MDSEAQVAATVDFVHLLPLDILLRVVLFLTDARDVLNAAHVNAKLRRVFFERNAFGLWLADHLPKKMGDDLCLFLELNEHRKLVDPLERCVMKVDSLRPMIAWGFSAKGIIPSVLFSWFDYRQAEKTPESKSGLFCALLPPGRFPSLYLHKGVYCRKVDH